MADDDELAAVQRQMTETHDAASRFAQRLIGLTRSGATELSTEDGRFAVQFIAEDAMVTLDFRPSRIRATVVEDRVVSATAG